MHTTGNKCLFVFTKQFPFGTAEQYLVDEVPYLLEQFQKIVFVPCELFDLQGKVKRTLPSQCEVLLLNEEGKGKRTPKNYLKLVSVFTAEFFRCRSKSWFIKERKRYASVLTYQLHLSFVFEEILKQRYSGYHHTFYAYWIHNSSIMLSLMKERGAIRDFICRGHSIDLYESDWALVRYIKILPFYHYIIQNASRVYAISGHGADYLKSRFPALHQKFKFSRLGVIAGGDNSWISDHEFIIVSCSNFTENKNVRKIAEVVGHLRGNVRWIHFGNGPEDAVNAVKKIIERYPQRITAELRGYTPNEEIRKFYAEHQVNLFINLSEAEGIPVSMMEAISFGIPVLASAVYGNPEVANELTGFSVPCHSSPSEIAGVITAFQNDPEEQKRIRLSAKKYYREYFSAAVNYREFSKEIANL
ncbi:MAG: hypothetical protein Fur0041_15180 [Bacteroidia bacterium]